MTLVSRLEFANHHRPPYFDPDTDIEIGDNDEADWRALFVTSYSLSTLIDALRHGTVSRSAVRFAEADARTYLRQLMDADVDPRLHHHEHMTRVRLIALVTEGYTAVDDLLENTDAIDIARETGIDRAVITRIATTGLDGFSTGNSVGRTGPLADLDPNDSFTGWDLVTASPHRIRWVSAGRFSLTITPTPTGKTTVSSTVPKAEQNAWYRKGHSFEAPPAASLTPEDALERAHDWLATHQLTYADDLTQYPYIGAATKDYLALEYDITSIEALRTFATTQPDEFDAIFGSPGAQLRATLRT